MDQFSGRQNNLCKAELIPHKVLTHLEAGAKLLNPCRSTGREVLGLGSAGQPWISCQAGRRISGRESSEAMGEGGPA